MALNELKILMDYIIHQLSWVNLDARENIEAIAAKLKNLQKS